MDLKIRQVVKSDLDGCYDVERMSYSTEGASKERIEKRIRVFPQGFLVAESNGRIVGIINGTSTNKEDISNEKLKDMIDFDKNGKNLVIFSLAVLPEFRGKGISKLLMNEFIKASKMMKKNKILLICKENLIAYYAKFGFIYAGKSKSKHGGFDWHEMYLPLSKK